jgi:hypothetical protein
MVEPQEVEMAIQQMHALLKQMQVTIEWEQAAQINPRTDLPPAFRLQSHINTELRALAGLFFNLADATNRAIEHGQFYRAQQQYWLGRIAALEQQVRGLHLSERFKNG